MLHVAFTFRMEENAKKETGMKQVKIKSLATCFILDSCLAYS
jgi:hypothetical protein